MTGKTVRIGVGTPDGLRSSVWRVTPSKSDVYVAQGSGGNEKLSFHASGICRRAFTREYGTPKSLADRAMMKWNRAPTGPAGSGHFSYAATITVPTNFLSTVLKPERKPVIWVPPTPLNSSVVLEFFFTRESKIVVESHGAAQYRVLISYMPLHNGEAFVISAFRSEFAGQEIVLPASHGAKHDIVISSDDPTKSGRPIRITFFQDATETRPLLITEYGAYRTAKGTKYPERMGVLTRHGVFDRRGDSW
jgi:hypothetical protein